MNYHRMLTADVANGVGIRVVLFVSGCNRHCKGCHNPQTWDFESGKPFTGAEFIRLMEALKPAYIDGMTLSGGDPFAEENLPVTTQLAMEVKNINKSVWAYTGDVYENVKDFPIMRYVDVLVDGDFQIDKKDLMLKFRGSSNQRIIDVPASRNSGKVMELSF